MAIDRSVLHLTGNLFRNSIEREFPQWLKHLQVVDGNSLELETTQPNGARTLCIRVDEAKVSIRYGDWGFVTGTFLGWSEQQLVDDTIQTLRSIVTEENIVQVTHTNGEWSGASLNRPFLEPDVKDGQVITIYSWRGTHDRTIEGPARS